MAESPRPAINLLRGWPNPALLPITAMRDASTTALVDPQTSVTGLSYAPDGGYEPLRQQIAIWLSEFYGPHFGPQPPPPITPERLCISGGASQNLACVLQAYTDPVYTRYIWMVAPTYYLACRMMEDAGFKGRLRAIAEDSEGIDIAALRSGLETAEREAERGGNTTPKLKPAQPWNKRFKHLIYCVPTFSNPSGRTMTLARRQALVQTARMYDALLVTDDVYDHLIWPHTSSPSSSTRSSPHLPTQAIAPRLVDVDRFLDGGTSRPGADGFGNALSQGSFSKLAGPGCRTGWAEGAPKAAYGLSQVGSSRSGGAPSALVATFMAEMLKGGTLQAWIHQELQPKLAMRCKRLRRAVEELLCPLGVRFWDEGQSYLAQEYEGGYFVAIQLPGEIEATALAERCKVEEDVVIAPGAGFAVVGDETTGQVDLGRMVRLCFAWEAEEEEQDSDERGVHRLKEGVQRIANVLARMLSQNGAKAVETKGTRNGVGFANEDT